MSDLCALYINGERILVLYKSTKYGKSLSLRKAGGWIGKTLPLESAYLKDHPELVEKLKAGEVIKL